MLYPRFNPNEKKNTIVQEFIRRDVEFPGQGGGG